MRRYLLIALIVLVVALAAVGCGGGGSKPTSLSGGVQPTFHDPTVQSPHGWSATEEAVLKGGFPPPEWNSACVVALVEKAYPDENVFQTTPAAVVTATSGIDVCYLGGSG